MNRITNLILMLPLLGVCLGATCAAKPTPQDMGPPRDLAAIGDLAVPAGIGACPVKMPLPVATDVCDGLFTAGDGTYYACVRCEAAGCMDTVDKMYCVVGSCTGDKRCSKPLQMKKLPKPQIKRGK